MLKDTFYVYCPKTGYTKFQHHNRLEAEKEAERLARLYPGDKFQILELLSEVWAADIIWDHIDPIPF